MFENFIQNEKNIIIKERSKIYRLLQLFYSKSNTKDIKMRGYILPKSVMSLSLKAIFITKSYLPNTKLSNSYILNFYGNLLDLLNIKRAKIKKGF